MTRLETERLVLRLPRLDDAAEHLTDPEVMRYIGVDGETVRREECVEVVRKWLDRWKANGFGQFAVERLVSIVHPDNVASARVAEKLGARPGEAIETPYGPAMLWVYPR